MSSDLISGVLSRKLNLSVASHFRFVVSGRCWSRAQEIEECGRARVTDATDELFCDGNQSDISRLTIDDRSQGRSSVLDHASAINRGPWGIGMRWEGEGQFPQFAN